MSDSFSNFSIVSCNTGQIFSTSLLIVEVIFALHALKSFRKLSLEQHLMLMSVLLLFLVQSIFFLFS